MASAPVPAHSDVEQDDARPLAVRSPIGEQFASGAERNREDHGRLGQLGDTRAHLDLHTKLARTHRQAVDQGVPAADHIADLAPLIDEPFEALLAERGRQLPGISWRKVGSESSPIAASTAGVPARSLAQVR